MKSHMYVTCAACVIVVLGLSGMASGQRIVHVSPAEFGILNSVIANDTLGNGERIDPNTIYELERGPYAYYVLSSSIKNNGYHLTIVAEDGDGERPKIVPGVISGGESSRCFRPASDLTLKGLYVTNVDQSGAWNPKNILRLQGEGIRLVVDDCHLDGDIQSHVRFDAHDQRVFITNSILSNSLYNGRSLDRRGNRIDTLVVENCTFYNLISEVVREGDSGFVKYFKFNHNTVVNVGVEFCEIGETVTCIFTNNLVINTGFFGDRTDTPGSNHILEIFPITSWQLDGYTQHIEFRNNNFYTDTEIAETQANLVLDGFEVQLLPLIDDVGSALVDTSQFIHERIQFTVGPSLDTTLNIIRVVWEEYDGNKDYAPPFDNRNVGEFGEEGFGTVPFDFSYPTTTLSYTAADGNLPLGDLNWFDIEIPEGVRGDVNADKAINVLDVLAVVNHILGTIPLVGSALEMADCNNDAIVNVLDALGIVNVILGVNPDCPGGAAKVDIYPETIGFLETLKPFLSDENFAGLMTMIKEVGLPSQFSLGQNYPNPFNPQTYIEYGLPYATDVRLSIYNTLGQETEVLVSERMEAGFHTATWTAGDMPSGIYYCRLQTREFTETRRMILLR